MSAAPRWLAIAAIAMAASANAAEITETQAGELLAAAASVSGRPLPAVAPPFVALPLAELMRAACTDDGDDCKHVVAAYDAQRGVVLHRDDFDMGKALDRSFIVHELVHFLQHREAGDAFGDAGCAATLRSEREAYAVQNKYLRQHNARRRVGQGLKFTQCAAGAADDRHGG